mgnify:CR=1 FL=1
MSTTDAMKQAANDAATELLEQHMRGDLDLTDLPSTRAFLMAWIGGWERDETDEADDHHSERADQEAWT